MSLTENRFFKSITSVYIILLLIIWGVNPIIITIIFIIIWSLEYIILPTISNYLLKKNDLHNI